MGCFSSRWQSSWTQLWVLRQKPVVQVDAQICKYALRSLPSVLPHPPAGAAAPRGGAVRPQPDADAVQPLPEDPPRCGHRRLLRSAPGCGRGARHICIAVSPVGLFQPPLSPRLYGKPRNPGHPSPSGWGGRPSNACVHLSPVRADQEWPDRCCIAASQPTPPPLRGVLCGAGCVLHVDGLWPLRQQPVYQLAVRRVPPRGLAPGPPVLSPGVTPEGHACRRLWLGPKTFSAVPQIKVAKFQVVAWLCQLLRVRSESCV